MTAPTTISPATGTAERERVLRLLRAEQATLRARGIRRLRLFGSVARGEAGAASDVDLAADLEPEADFSLIDHAGLEQELALALGRPVEISTAIERMRPRIRHAAERDAVEVF